MDCVQGTLARAIAVLSTSRPATTHAERAHANATISAAPPAKNMIAAQPRPTTAVILGVRQFIAARAAFSRNLTSINALGPIPKSFLRNSETYVRLREPA